MAANRSGELGSTFLFTFVVLTEQDGGTVRCKKKRKPTEMEMGCIFLAGSKTGMNERVDLEWRTGTKSNLYHHQVHCMKRSKSPYVFSFVLSRERGQSFSSVFLYA